MRGEFVAVACGALVGACAGYGPGDNPTRVTDSTGAVFGWSCDDSDCGASSVPGSPAFPMCTGDEGGTYDWIAGRFVSLCLGCVAPGGTWNAPESACRPLACTSDSDCPLFYQFDPVLAYQCVNGLCESTDRSLHPREATEKLDVLILCFADHQRDETSSPLSPASQAIQTRVTMSCPDAQWTQWCPVPPDCRQP